MKNVMKCVVLCVPLCAASSSALAQWSTNGAKVYYSNGLVGIGTSNPAHKLDVRSATDRTISAQNSATSGSKIAVYGKTSSNTGYASYFVGGRNYMEKRLGIGRINPSQKLDVNGNIKVSGWIGTNVDAPVELRSNNSPVIRGWWVSSTGLGPSANVVAGWEGNSISAGVIGATIAGGGGDNTGPSSANGSDDGSVHPNQVSQNFGTVGGGHANHAQGTASTVGGGVGNTASGYYSNVGGGANNQAGDFATILGGTGNNAVGDYTAILGGFSNSANGSYGVVLAGRQNDASGDYSLAAGRRAKANSNGAFVWADSTDANFNSNGVNTVTMRASGGIYLYTSANLSSGVYVLPGSGSWTSVSDRNVKENLQLVNAREVLNRIASLQISTWNYISQDEDIRHIGPMAQDFKTAFDVGEDERGISTVDAHGVALAGIQGLHQIVQEKDAEIAELRERLQRIEMMLVNQSGASDKAVSNGGTE